MVRDVEQDWSASFGHDDSGEIFLVACGQVVIPPKTRRAHQVWVHLFAELLHAEPIDVRAQASEVDMAPLARKLLIALWRYVRTGELPAGVALHPAT